MNLTWVFIRRPIATTLLTAAIALAGLVAFNLLPVAPLPQVDFPAVYVQVSLPGASPETMAATVATPLERTLGRIAGIEEITSSSATGQTFLSLVFDLDRNIDGAARDVMAAINAARTLLPTGLPFNPLYRKVNPADAPILIMALTSPTLTPGEIYDAASTILAQRLSQVDGVGQVTVGGSSLPAVRVELSPPALNRYGLALEDVRTAIASTNTNRPKGFLEDESHRWQIQDNDQAMRAAEYRPLVVAWRNGAPVRLSDVAQVEDSVQDLLNLGLSNGRRAILLIVNRQPNANIIETVDRIMAVVPHLRASIPPAIDLKVVMDRTTTIRASLHDVERTLAIATALVILVVFLFLREAHAALIPSVAVPVSLIGTFGVMYLFHYSLDNLSLMALTVSTGFVVDDAIVMLENISRHIESGLPPLEAALKGAKEVSFTVISISVSLIAVFVPLLLMGGLVGRMFREFAVVLSVAVLVSLVISLTTTPMMCARLLRKTGESPQPDPGTKPAHSVIRRFAARWIGTPVSRLRDAFDRLHLYYEHSLKWAVNHRRLVLAILLATIGLNVYLYIIVPKGFFPQQDTGRLIGRVQADQSISFQAMRAKLAEFIAICKADPDAQEVIGFTGGQARNAANVYVVLKPPGVRHASSDEVIARLRRKLARVAGASLYFQAAQDVRFGGRMGNAQYQYTLQGNDLEELRQWEPKIKAAFAKLPELADVNTDQQDKGLDVYVTIDRDTAARLGVSAKSIDLALNDLYGQRIISNIYNPLNQYRVVMEAAPQFWQSPAMLEQTYVTGANGSVVPLSAVAHFSPGNAALAVNHQGQFPASTITFNLPIGVSLGQATKAIDNAFLRLGVPASIQGGFQGTAKVFRSSLANQPLLIFGALLAVYIVLGILYESLVHPLTILSTLPSAGVGALLALLATHVEFSLMALIGVILLIGIVKKNAIMMIDFALQAERQHGLAPEAAIMEACKLRFRPIMMTTLAAMLGALPLAVGWGVGSELRRPLGISILGGLAVSQVLTLYTTPVVYIYLDRFRTTMLARFNSLRRVRESH
ncbi:MAG: efflux RND transporter permease subunit [Betaproteobacteria bacterium]|nr:efflux RND transporter permease subunit [Betaproteobacteria bacterium]MDE2621840.1 efflux RND transporter permease subunit [Betaproteobacteria bacterium]